ncbi:clathrin light chain isoform X2 [Hyalella azteca]|uniref:Clathrin light chain n=2 Tax=Hyalella azteca TaxID=294128 RepID=A0A8B7PIJ2_HYAAZ|nr:clathrin light chain isoform X2 [Hyalella azteca]
MDGFGDNFVPNGNGLVDPAAEFLAREQDELAGLEDPPQIAPFDVAPDAAIAEADALQQAADEANYAAAAAAAASGADVMGTPLRTPERVMTPVPRVEPEAIKIWREEHQRKLVMKDEAEEEAKEALREKAKQELADWYKQHDEQVAKTRQANREACKSAEKELVADTERPEPGTEWERIAKLCDFNPKTAKSSRDVSRMRSIILHVKQSPPLKA